MSSPSRKGSGRGGPQYQSGYQNPNAPRLQFQQKPTLNQGNSGLHSKSTATPGSILGMSPTQFHDGNFHMSPNSNARRANSSMRSAGSSTHRSAKRALGDASKDNTIVFKNFPLKTTERDVESLIKNSGMDAEPTHIILHSDASSGMFKGTVFVKFDSSDGAEECVNSLEKSFEFGGRKVKMELLKKNKKDRFGSGVERGMSSTDVSHLAPPREGQDEPTEEEMELVAHMVQLFAESDGQDQLNLPPTDNPHMRKYQHSVAERYELFHSTEECGASGHKNVVLKKRAEDKTRAGAAEKYIMNGSPLNASSTKFVPMEKGIHADADLQLVFLADDLHGPTAQVREPDSLNIGLLATPEHLAPSPVAQLEYTKTAQGKNVMPAEVYNSGGFSTMNSQVNQMHSGAMTMPNMMAAAMSPMGMNFGMSPMGLGSATPANSPFNFAGIDETSPFNLQSIDEISPFNLDIGMPPGLGFGMPPMPMLFDPSPSHAMPSVTQVMSTAGLPMNVLRGMTPTARAVEGMLAGELQTNLPPGPYAFGPFKTGDSEIDRDGFAKNPNSVFKSGSLSPLKARSLQNENRAKGPDGSDGFHKRRSLKWNPNFSFKTGSPKSGRSNGKKKLSFKTNH